MHWIKVVLVLFPILFCSPVSIATIITPVSGTLIVHYNPDVLDPETGGPEESALNIAWIELANGVLDFATPAWLPDPENHGCNISIFSPFATGAGHADYMAHALHTLDSGVNPVFEFEPHGGTPCYWTLDYYSPENGLPVNDPSRTRMHTLLFGSFTSLEQEYDPANDGTGGIPDIQYLSVGLSVDDEIYHAMSLAEIYNNDLWPYIGGSGDYNEILFEGTLYERNDGINDDGLNYWDGSGYFASGLGTGVTASSWSELKAMY
ncbi:MAG: hypothetical protein QF492_08590 [Candidatus Krumholzibacteria bacterium]|jgi:hypothetical protein|nr:hypothetical protein [Candidatus Krumholzibacteria bacterium]MDP6796960.1 hypothetical protein [Candidatus Krumholzibacteria bacterium]MDP7021115.1 hypothetical protein [Candidatus Krumholzibacteria bacterium]